MKYNLKAYLPGALRMTTYETEIIIFDDCNEYMRLVGLLLDKCPTLYLR